MDLNDMLLLAVPTMIFACGMALLSHRFYAAYRRWPIGEFSYKIHLPGVLGAALMLFATLWACSLGWGHLAVTVLAGCALAHFYVHVFRMRVETALLGPVLVLASVFLMGAGW